MAETQGQQQPGAPAQGPINVVLDANVTFQHRRLDGPTFDLLEQFLRRTESKLVVPEITVQEAVKKHREEATKKLRDANSAIKGLDQFLTIPSGATPPTATAEATTEGYEQLLRMRLDDLDADTPDYEEVPAVAIAERALQERRPFMPEDRGIRDVLFWETVLRKVVEKERQTILVTNDGGFADGDDLHPDLAADLERMGHSRRAVDLVKTIEQFNEVYAKPLLSHMLSAAVSALRKGEYSGFDVSDFVSDQAQVIREEVKSLVPRFFDEARRWFRHLRAMHENPELSYLEFDPKQATVDEVLVLDNDRVFIRVSLSCEAQLDGFIDKSDFYPLSDDSDLSVMDSDWNDHCMWVETCVDGTLTINLTFDLDIEDVDDWEVESFLPKDPNWQALAEASEDDD